MQSLYLSGRCTNGSELDCGTLYHAVPDAEHSNRALCGAKPGRRSAGWRGHDEQSPVTCSRCLKRMARRVCLCVELPEDERYLDLDPACPIHGTPAPDSVES